MPNYQESPIVWVAGADAAMASAMTHAQSTFKYLWRELTWEYRRIVPALDLSAVKLAFSDTGGTADDVEHMWLSEIRFNGDTVRATLMSEPHQLRSVQAGDELSFGVQQIEDWMYVIDEHVYGGFTIQCMRASMAESERHEHDEAWGLSFPPHERVELVPQWKARARPGSLERILGDPMDAEGSREDPDAEHPMSVAMAGELAAAIAKDPGSFLGGRDDEGLTTLHSLALGGSAACVKVLLDHGADVTARTTAGHTALDLAEGMGWSSVANILRKATS